jgi:ABC-type multidrug transport system fused ATPase/permease subunit
MGIAINKLFAQLLFWLYEFLDTIFEMFRVLCGIDTVSVEGTDGGQSILNVFLEASSVTKAFLLMLLVAILVAAVSTIVTVVKNIVNMKGGERKSHARTLGQGFGSIIVTCVMAFVMLFGITMSNYVLIQVDKATNASNGNLTISARLFDMSVGKSYVYDYKNVTYEPIPVLDEFGEEMKDEEGNPIVERDEQGNIIYEEVIPLMRDENGNLIIESGWRNGHSAEELDFSIMSPDDVFGVHKKDFIGLFEDPDKSYKQDPMVEMESFNFWTAYLVVIVMLVALIFSMLGLVKRIFDIVLLFLVLPLISATIPLDDGARFKNWRDTVVSKVILAYGAILSVNVFLLIIPTINAMNFSELWDNAFVENLFKAFMMMGGALAINGGQLLLARLMGTSADESREMAHSARALLSGAVAAGGVVRGAKNLAFGGYNKYGRFRTGILPRTARVGNTAGNFFGGAQYANSKAGGFMRFLGRYGHGSGNPNFGMRYPESKSKDTDSNSSSGGGSSNAVEQAMSGSPDNGGGSAQYEREQPTSAPQSAPAQSAPAPASSAQNNDHHAGLLNDVLPKGDGGGAFTPPKKK